MRFTSVILKNVLHRKTRTVLTISALTLAVTAMVFLWSVAWGFAESADRYFAKRGVDIVVVRAGVMDRLTSSLRGEIVNRLTKVPGIADVDASLTEMISIGEGSLVGIPLHGFRLDGFSIRQLALTEGRTLQAGDRNSVLLGQGVAESLKKHAGQTLAVEGSPFTVAGVFTSDDPGQANSIVMSLPETQKLMDRPDQVTEIQIHAQPQFQNDAAIRALCHRIEELPDEHQLPLGLKAQPARQFVDNATETKLATSMAWGTSAIVLLLSVLGMFNTMLMSVLERTREIGILRAVGWPRGRVVRMILGESLVVSLFGAALGVVGARLTVEVLAHWPLTKALVAPNLSLGAVLCGITFAVIAGLAGAFYPAFHGASIPATEALRYE